ncbi:MAG: hypothetical protein GY898_05335 [Proteobacteria bacterium]|nr:hypothetical protein [Pseudomonadota bacterium]
MTILGICDGHDAGAALLDHAGVLQFAVSEERLTRRKHQCGFPRRSIEAALRFAAARGWTVEHAALAEQAGRLPFRLLDRRYRTGRGGRGPLSWAARAAGAYSNAIARHDLLATVEGTASVALVRRRLSAVGVNVPLIVIDHHLAHAWSAAVGVDERWADALVVTLDAFGDGLAGTVSRRRGRNLDRLTALPAPAGPALLFGALAQHLGYAEGDEGKVVARAAAGDPERLVPVARAAFAGPGLSPAAFIRAVRHEPPEDIAAALQHAAEGWVADIVGEAHAAHGGTALALAGGLFANVAINRAVAAAVPGVPVFVTPAMGDAGLCAGAAAAAAALLGIEPQPTPDACLGPATEDVAAQAAPDVGPIRRALEDGGVVARCVGRMEFGPRALGARSLLFLPDDPARGAALNAALGRDPVMPFGPILPVEAAPTYLEGWDETAAPMTAFMTVALPATDALRRAAPAAVHADGTARAQVLREVDDPALHRFLLSLDEPVLVNTSLNLHGEPIVATLEEAARTAAAAGCAALWSDVPV